MTDHKDNYTGMLLEDLQHTLQRFAEAMSDVPSEIQALRADVTELKSDMVVVKSVVTDVSRNVNDHERRLTTLEQVA